MRNLYKLGSLRWLFRYSCHCKAKSDETISAVEQAFRLSVLSVFEILQSFDCFSDLLNIELCNTLRCSVLELLIEQLCVMFL